MMTEDEISKYVFINQMVSVMNDTKWKELVAGITADPNFSPPVNIKYLFDDDNNNLFSPVWWQEIEREGFKIIEWIEIKPVKEDFVGHLVKNTITDYTQFIKAALDKYNIPYQFDNSIFRINGYIRTQQ